MATYSLLAKLRQDVNIEKGHVLVILGAVDFYLTDGQRPGVVGVPGQPFTIIDELGDVAPALQVLLQRDRGVVGHALGAGGVPDGIHLHGCQTVDGGKIVGFNFQGGAHCVLLT